LHGAILGVPEADWDPYGEDDRDEIRECAAVPFVPGEKSEHKDTKPLRYVRLATSAERLTLWMEALRLLPVTGQPRCNTRTFVDGLGAARCRRILVANGRTASVSSAVTTSLMAAWNPIRWRASTVACRRRA